MRIISPYCAGPSWQACARWRPVRSRRQPQRRIIRQGCRPGAGKGPSKESVTLTGTVKVVKNDKGKVTDVEFSSDDGATYSVKKGPEGRMLEMQDGKKIEGLGSVLDQKGKKLLV